MNSVNELENQRNELRDQKLHLELSYGRINESLNYAQKIQNAVLSSSDKYLNMSFENFVLFYPREAVSGDFYWSRQIDHFTVVVAADCTGHGVPGAFLSMLGYAFLNDNVRNADLSRPNLILDSLREMVKESLKQTGERGERKDGMDMAMIVIDKFNKKLFFAGANNPAVLIRNKKEALILPEGVKTHESESSVLLEFQADNQPIGIHQKEQAFKTVEFNLQNGDLIYLYSDGFADQVGGEHGRKFGRERFRELLLSISDSSLENQKKIFETSLDDWKSNKEQLQVDDILVLGFRFDNF